MHNFHLNEWENKYLEEIKEKTRKLMLDLEKSKDVEVRDMENEFRIIYSHVAKAYNDGMATVLKNIEFVYGEGDVLSVE